MIFLFFLFVLFQIAQSFSINEFTLLENDGQFGTFADRRFGSCLSSNPENPTQIIVGAPHFNSSSSFRSYVYPYSVDSNLSLSLTNPQYIVDNVASPVQRGFGFLCTSIKDTYTSFDNGGFFVDSSLSSVLYPNFLVSTETGENPINLTKISSVSSLDVNNDGVEEILYGWRNGTIGIAFYNYSTYSRTSAVFYTGSSSFGSSIASFSQSNQKFIFIGEPLLNRVQYFQVDTNGNIISNSTLNSPIPSNLTFGGSISVSNNLLLVGSSSLSTDSVRLWLFSLSFSPNLSIQFLQTYNFSDFNCNISTAPSLGSSLAPYYVNNDLGFLVGAPLAGRVFVIRFSTCGDGIKVNGEQCDDDNNVNDDGCSSICQIEIGWSCNTPDNTISTCSPICGDGIERGSETCDDGNLQNDDGCSSSCQYDNNNNSSSSSAGLVAAVVVVVVCCCLIFLVGASVTFWWFRRTNKKHSAELSSMFKESGVPILDHIKVGEVIGSGNFGKVYRGDWNDTPVALKSVKEENDITNEFKMLKDLRHPNIVIFYGVYNHQGQIMMVTEFMNKGDLLNLLRTVMDFGISDFCNFSYQTAQGMDYLHSQNILHRDLASRNLLVHFEARYTIKVSDFGLSRQTEGEYESTSREIPVRWTAPEALEFFKFSKSSDVFSFGITLWEIFSRGGIPYGGLSNRQVSEHVISGGRPKLLSDIPELINQLMTDCWKKNPEERPTFSQIVSTLSSLVSSSSIDVRGSTAINTGSVFQNSTSSAPYFTPRKEGSSIYH